MRNWVKFSSYKAAELHWQDNPKIDYRAFVSGTKHRIEAFELIFCLTMFAKIYKDQRFDRALQALEDNDIVDGYSWKHETIVPQMKVLEPMYRLTARIIVGDLLSENVSLRLAYATCAANLGFPGNSFSAAVKAVERLWGNGLLDNDIAQLSNDAN